MSIAKLIAEGKFTEAKAKFSQSVSEKALTLHEGVKNDVLIDLAEMVEIPEGIEVLVEAAKSSNGTIDFIDSIRGKEIDEEISDWFSDIYDGSLFESAASFMIDVDAGVYDINESDEDDEDEIHEMVFAMSEEFMKGMKDKEPDSKHKDMDEAESMLKEGGYKEQEMDEGGNFKVFTKDDMNETAIVVTNEDGTASVHKSDLVAESEKEDSGVMYEEKRIVKVNSKGEKRVRKKCRKGFKLQGNRCVPVSGKEKAGKRIAIRKSVKTKKAAGASFQKKVNFKRKKALKKRKSFGLGG